MPDHSPLGIDASVTGCWHLAFRCHLHLGRRVTRDAPLQPTILRKEELRREIKLSP